MKLLDEINSCVLGVRVVHALSPLPTSWMLCCILPKAEAIDVISITLLWQRSGIQKSYEMRGDLPVEEANLSFPLGKVLRVHP